MKEQNKYQTKSQKAFNIYRAYMLVTVLDVVEYQTKENVKLQMPLYKHSL